MEAPRTDVLGAVVHEHRDPRDLGNTIIRKIQVSIFCLAERLILPNE